MTAGVNRREFLATVAAAQGAFVLGFWMPQTSGRADGCPAPSGTRSLRRLKSMPGS